MPGLGIHHFGLRAAVDVLPGVRLRLILAIGPHVGASLLEEVALVLQALVALVSLVRQLALIHFVAILVEVVGYTRDPGHSHHGSAIVNSA